MNSSPDIPQTIEPPSEAQGTTDETTGFLAAVFARSDLVEIRGIETWEEDGNKHSRLAERYWIKPAEIPEAELHRLNATGINIFFGVCPRPTVGKGKSSDVELVRCLWADLDNCSVAEARERCNRAGIPMPSIIVASGHGVHLYWLLQRAHRIKSKADRTQLSSLLSSMYDAIGGDHTQDLSRLLRLPGFLNVKDHRNGKTPVPCRLIECSPTRRYSLKDFSRWMPTMSTNGHAQDVDEALFSGRPDGAEIKKVISRLDEPGERSDRDFGVIRSLHELGVNEQECWQLVRNKSKFADRGRAYFDGTWKKASAEKPDPPQGTRSKGSQATSLVNMANDVELFHSPDSVAFATFPVTKHSETWPLRSKSFRDWLAHRFYREAGTTPNSTAMHDALGVLEGKARFDGDEHSVHLRMAECDGRIYLDLANTEWQAIEITAKSWQVIDTPPVKFRRANGMLPLPVPVRGGSVGTLRKLLNIRGEADWQLVLAWLLAAMHPWGPFPALVLTGEQGSAKSTCARALRSLVDPNSAPLRSQPRDDRDLMIAATNGWITVFDNLSHIPRDLSDSLCRLATGGGFATRRLFTDQDEVLLDAQRPVILNGIEELATRSDLLDRCIVISLPPIPEGKRRPESELWNDFECMQPRILGALLDTMCGALRRLPQLKLDKYPRMADFARFSTAVERTLGWKRGSFLAAYKENRLAANEVALESSPVVPVVVKLLEKDTRWGGTATDLLTKLDGIAGFNARQRRGWPKASNALSGILRRLAPNLRLMGIDIQFKKAPKGTHKLIKLARIEGGRSGARGGRSSAGRGRSKTTGGR